MSTPQRIKPSTNLEGRVFNQLTVLEFLHVEAPYGRIWLCQCECGNKTTASSGNLSNGNKRSCGCGHGHKLIGVKVGATTVIAKSGVDKQGAVVWLCRCDCGETRLATSAQINAKNIRLCKCQRNIDGRTAPKSHDLTGRTFDRLTVVEQVPTNKKQARWLCDCLCGNKTSVLASCLVYGTTKSCGCLRKESKRHGRNSTQESLIGKVYGRYTVISQIDEDGRLRDRWLCRCECGTEKAVGGKPLRTGNTKSCGCLKAEIISESRSIDVQGQSFGMLNVVSRLPRVPGSLEGAQWLCACACGNSKVFTTARLRRGLVNSCGCVRRRHDALFTSDKRTLDLRSNLQRRRARVAETGGTFTAEDVNNRYRWQRGRCAGPHCRNRLHGKFEVDHITPISPRHRNGAEIFNLNDRRNTQLLCTPCNRAKGDKDPIDYNRKNGFLL